MFCKSIYKNIQDFFYPSTPFTPTSKKELQKAVDLWCESAGSAVPTLRKNEGLALEKYGNINTWNVSKITDMENLFKKK